MDKKADLFKKAKSIPIEDVIEKYLGVDTSKFRWERSVLCPFHADKTAGSFSIDKKRNKYRCFSCGEGGDGINLVSHVKEKLPYEATLTMLADFEILTEGQVAQLRQGNNLTGSMQAYKKERALSEESGQKADASLLNKVYRTLAQGNTLIGKPILSEEHLFSLREVRGLTDNEIKKAGFFTFPERIVLAEFLKMLWKKEGVHPWEIKNVPGFFTIESLKWADPSTKKPFSAVSFTEMKGIGIPIRNEKGEIQAIQIRKDNVKKGEQRYVFFSSSYAAQEEGKLTSGASSGSPMDFHYPTGQCNRTLFITEGKFKSLAIAKTFKSASISVQGVSSWRGIEEVIKEARVDFTRIIIAFDGDWMENEAVLKQLFQLSEACTTFKDKELRISFWDTKYGKGIDDVIAGGDKSMLSSVPFSSIRDEIEETLTEIKKLKKNPEKKKSYLEKLKTTLLSA